MKVYKATHLKKGKRKVQGVPQSQTAALRFPLYSIKESPREIMY